MSDLSPFDHGGLQESGPSVQSDIDVFKPPLAGVDMAAYEARQDLLDPYLASRNSKELGELLVDLHARDPEAGITLNNLHGVMLTGSEIEGLQAPLSVMSASDVRVNLPGINFSGGVASEADFSGVDLSGGNFTNAVLPRAKFVDADLTGTDFTNVVLTEADFTGAKVRGADLTGAYLINPVGLSPEQVMQMKLNATRAWVPPSEVDAKLEQLLASRFGEYGTLEDYKHLLEAIPVALSESLGKPIPRLQAKTLLRGLYARNANWTQADFTGSDLTGATIEELEAKQGSFRAAAMGGVVIRNARMQEFDMHTTWAPGMVMESVDLRGSRLSQANLVGAVLRDVDLRGVTGLGPGESNVEGIVIGEDCKLPQGYGYDGVRLQVSSKLQKELEA